MRDLIRRFWYLLHRDRHDAELAEELETHRAMAQEDLEARGLAPRDAAMAAERALGNHRSARERADDAWGWGWLRDLVQDVRVAARMLVKAPAFAVTVIVVLALGLGVNHLFVMLIYASTMRGLPIARVDRVLFVSTFDDRQTDRALSYPQFEEIRDGARAFAGIAAYTNAPVVIGDEGRAPDRFDGAYLSGNAFDVIGVQPVAGRGFSAADDRPGAEPVVMLGHGAWQARYGGDRGIVGGSLLVNGTPATVIGVVPPRSGFPSTAEVWMPLVQMPGMQRQSHAAGSLRVIGRLRDEVTVSDGRAEIEAIVERCAREHQDTSRHVRARVVPINDRFFAGPVGVWVAFISAAFLIVGVCAANVANLMLARGVQRTQEIAIRASLGASRGRVVRQLVGEAAVLAALGGAIGAALAVGGVWLFERAVPANLLPYWFDFSPDLRVFGMLAGVSMLALLIFGVAPAFHAARVDVNLILKASGRVAMGRRGTGRWTSGFLVAQLGLSTVLLALLVLATRNDTPDLPSDVAIDSPLILTAAVALPNDAFATPALRSSYYDRLLDRVRALPGVSSATVATALPRGGAVEQSVEIAGRQPGDAPSAWTISVGRDYFETLGLSLLQGRGFRDGDGRSGDTPAIVNARFVDQLLGGADAIGQRVTLEPARGTTAGAPTSVTIIGIAPDVRQRPAQTPDPLVYLPFDAAVPANAALIVRERNGRVDAAGLRAAAFAASASVPAYRIMTMAGVFDEREWNGRVSAQLVMLVSLVSIALAAVGLYAVTAYSVSERTQEIGLRMALGAGATQVSRMIVRRAFVQVGLGLIMGIVGTVAWDRAFAGGDRVMIRLADPAALLGVCATLCAMTLVACLAPALRAMRLDPIVALRHE